MNKQVLKYKPVMLTDLAVSTLNETKLEDELRAKSNDKREEEVVFIYVWIILKRPSLEK